MRDEIMAEIRKKVEAEIQALAERIALLIEREAVKVIDEKNLIASGELRKSITHKVEFITGQVVATVFPTVKYAVFAHEGARPHFPPLHPIKRWILKKNILSMYSKRRTTTSAIRRNFFKGGKQKETTKKFVKDLNSLAYVIAKSIAKKGTKGVPFLKLALRQAEPQIRKEIEKFKVKV